MLGPHASTKQTIRKHLDATDRARSNDRIWLLAEVGGGPDEVTSGELARRGVGFCVGQGLQECRVQGSVQLHGVASGGCFAHHLQETGVYAAWGEIEAEGRVRETGGSGQFLNLQR